MNIDNLIEEWEESGSSLPVYEYLGWTREKWFHWLNNRGEAQPEDDKNELAGIKAKLAESHCRELEEIIDLCEDEVFLENLRESLGKLMGKLDK